MSKQSAPDPETAQPEGPSLGIEAAEYISELEGQLGALTGQVLQGQIVIRKLQAQVEGLQEQLVKKGNSNGD